MRVGLRAKVLAVALVLAPIPWLGYRHVQEMETVLRDGQEQALVATARAVATALHDRPELLELRPGVPADGEMERIVRGLGRAHSRIWIVDRQQRLLALAGDLRKSAAAEHASRDPLDWLARALRPVSAFLLERPTEEFDDALPEAVLSGAGEVRSALLGMPGRRWRHSPDARAVILSAAHPVWIGDEVVGAVVVEETTNAIRSLANRTLEKAVAATLVVFALAALVLLAFATRLSTRLRRLRDEAENAIDSQGHVNKLLAGSTAQDEIGDLSRSFSTALARLAQYNAYLKSLGGRLGHELRTPITVVRSSLENLRLEPLPESARVYTERAAEGLSRLEAMLTRMSEATRLESAVREAGRERFDAREVVRGCVSGYASAYPQRRFLLALPPAPVVLRGAPDLYAQMLDKLAANAADFSVPEEPIRVRLDAHGTLTVSNTGPPLPAEMAGRLFESMVSVRPEGGREPHLGLGLYIVRLIAEFHGGAAQAVNREDGSGVVVRVACPAQ
ncbi:MAG TPA: ATP-binding protein [Burkholderiales bacterium]|nr:ATP-binding protein [Burkholderiales bacterium]